MTFVPVPHVDDEQLIQTVWGNTVADDLTYLNGKFGGIVPQGSGTETQRPSASNAPGQTFFATDSKRMYLSDGAGWIIMYEPTQTFTPIWSGVTIGTGGSLTGEYERAGGWVEFFAQFILGSSGFALNGPVLTLPFSAGLCARNQLHVNIFNSGEWNYPAWSEGRVNSNNMPMYGLYAKGGTGGEFVNTSASINLNYPTTLGAGDGIDIGGRYRMQTRYS